jgi:hypothetical protein
MKRVALLAFVLAALVLASVGSAQKKPPPWVDNCTALNKKFPHGVGKAKARDKTKGTAPPVTNFRRSTPLYNKAMSFNKSLDRDKDGVACEN